MITVQLARESRSVVESILRRQSIMVHVLSVGQSCASAR
jgi:hypothetical protein